MACTLTHMRGAVLLVASLLALVVVGAGPHAEAGSRNDGRMTVIVGESGDIGPTPRLVMMDADGNNARVRLGWVYDASLSPDGRFIAYDQASARPTRGIYTREIRMVAADGRGSARLLVRNGAFVDWSSNGDAIAFVRFRHGCCDRGDLWVEDVHSRKQRLAVRNGRAPDWSPDGKKLAFVRGSDVWVVDLASKMARRLIRNADSPRWSPDGDRIAFLRYGQAESFIYVARADGTAERRVAEGESAAWSPDGRELAIAEFRRVSRIPLDGTRRRVVNRGCCAWRDLDWR